MGKTEPSQKEGIVDPDAWEEVEVLPGKKLRLAKYLQGAVRKAFIQLLVEFVDVFAWTIADVKGVPKELGEHRIDLKEDMVPVWQRQYRLNPKYPSW